MVRVAVCPGFNVIGVVIPVAPNRDPPIEIEEIVTGAVPEEVSITDCVPVLPTATFPNDTDVVLRDRAAAPVGDESVTLNVFVIPPALALMVAVCAVLTPSTVVVNAALVAPVATVTLPGTITAPSLVDRDTLTFAVAAEVRYTVQASVPFPL
jgi:hypothetical protein